MLQVGIESGDQQVLDNESKGIELEMVSQALHNLRTGGNRNLCLSALRDSLRDSP